MAQSVATARIGSFHFMAARAILAKCLCTAYPHATALHAANSQQPPASASGSTAAATAASTSAPWPSV